MLDNISETRLGEIALQLAALVRQMAQQLEVEGIVIRVTQSLRPWSEQEALYAQGRTAPGPIVTNAQAGSSWHNFGLAVDVAPFVESVPDWNMGHPVWGRIVSVGDSLGLVSGSEWRTFPDWPHFQYTGRFGVTPSDEVRAIFKSGGLQAVWDSAFGNGNRDAVADA